MRRDALGQVCYHCRYRLDGTTSRRCPECGADARWSFEPPRWSVLVVVAIGALVMILLPFVAALA